MKRDVVDSKIIGSAGYELEFKTTMGVGTVQKVTQEEWNEFLSSKSKGTHWNRYWKRSKPFSYTETQKDAR